MFVFEWFEALGRYLRRPVCPVPHHATALRPRRHPRLSFERLEERVLLSTFEVTTLGDPLLPLGVVSLRSAINSANLNPGADEIVFHAALSGEIALALGEIAITDDLTIRGGENQNVSINAQSLTRIFNVSGVGVDLTLERLTLRNGAALAGVVGGGAIQSTSTGNLTLTDCVLENNASGVLLGSGGAIASVGDVFLTRTTVAGNSTTANGAAGGAIQSGGDVVITGGALSGNSTSGNNATGGAVHANGDVTLIGVTVQGNSTAGTGAHGGAISAGTSLRIYDSVLYGNYTDGTGAHGGAVAATGSGMALIANSTLSGNSVNGSTTYGGGGLYASNADVLIVNSTITRNSAGVGGGIGLNANNGGESLTIDNSIVAGNTAANSPDFTAPGNPASNLLVRYSLIGSNAGTGLAATTGSTPDSLGNFIGPALAPIDPLLGPLQNNGGPTWTHALLAGSLADEGGSNDLAVDPTSGNTLLTTDQRGTGFKRLRGTRVDMGAFEAPHPVDLDGTIARINGADGDDHISYNAGTRTAVVNGKTFVLPGYITLVLIDGKLGTDTLSLVGTPGNDLTHVHVGSVLLECDPAHPGFDVVASNFEIVSVDGAGGAGDVAFLYDSANSDTFTASPGTGSMVGPGYQHGVLNFETIVGRAINGGSDDRATLNDSAGNDLFDARSTLANMAGAGYFLQAFGFNWIKGVATTGVDIGFLQDSAGDDTLTIQVEFGEIIGPSYFRRAEGFDVYSARALSGGVDTAILYDSTANDEFVSRGVVTLMRRNGGLAEAVAFEFVSGRAVNGGVDLAILYDTAGNDVFTATPQVATITTAGLHREAVGFELVAARCMLGGSDTATLTDSSGNDVLGVDVGVVNFTGAGFLIQTLNFLNVTVNSVNGGFDRAYFRDSIATDQFFGRGSDAEFKSGGRTVLATGFDQVSLDGTRGGLNVLNALNIDYALFRTGTWSIA